MQSKDTGPLIWFGAFFHQLSDLIDSLLDYFDVLIIGVLPSGTTTRFPSLPISFSESI